MCQAIGVRSIYEVDPADIKACVKVIKQAVEEPHVTVIIAKRPCALIPPGIGKKKRSSNWTVTSVPAARPASRSCARPC